MLTFVIIVVSLIFIIYFKLYEKLTFQHGRLTRPYKLNPTLTSITKMGPDQFIELSFGKVHYVYHKPSTSLSLESIPLNIFVHGYSTPMDMWQDIFQELANENQACLVYDLYGRGYSDSPDIPMDIDIFVSQLTELLYGLDLPYKKYNLFGVSMGGCIIQRFTQLYPSKVSKLILCCSGGLNVVKPSKLLMLCLAIPILGPILFKYTMTNSNDQRNRLQWAYPDSKKYEEHRASFQLSCQQHPGYLRALFSTIRNVDFESSLSSIEFVSKLNIPVLIIWGDRDTLIPVENAHHFHNLYKSSILKIVPGATHMILIEHSDQIIDSIKTFLNQ